MATEQIELLDAVDVYLDEGPGAPVLIGSLRASFMGGRTLGRRTTGRHRGRLNTYRLRSVR